MCSREFTRAAILAGEPGYETLPSASSFRRVYRHAVEGVITDRLKK